MSENLLLLPTQKLAERLKKKELSSTELLDKTLENIATNNPQLNAIVSMDAEAARVQAAIADERLNKGEGGKLEGLIITIKDSIDVADMHTTSGAPTYKDRIAQRDAPAVARLRQEGAIVIGKTNVPIFTGDWQSFNSLFGTTNNPWDITRSPGGSSGGAAASVASGMSAFELGSDFAGSIRWPSHACGLFGHRPTYGLVSVRGHVPPPPGSTFEPEFSTIGPIARSAEDLRFILEIIQGPAALDGVRSHLEEPSFSSPKGLRVAVWADDPRIPTDSEVSNAVSLAADLLAKEGAQVDYHARPDFSVREELDTFSLFNHAIMAAGVPEEVRKRLAERSRSFTADDRSHRALQARGAQMDANTWGNLQERKQKFIRLWQSFFRNYDVLLCPPAQTAAIVHDQRASLHERCLTVNGQEVPYFDLLYWASFASLSGLPASVAPVTKNSIGLPLGVQIISAQGHDLTTISVAAFIEKLGQGFVAPPTLL